MEEDLKPTAFMDFQDPGVAAFAAEAAGDAREPVDQAVRLYYAVRDGIRYDPYAFHLSEQGLKASTTLKNRRGWCVAKAILLAALCRYQSIPARLGFADVRNHLSTERLRKQMGTDVFYWHGYTSIHIHGRWVKATPAFNIELCEKFDLIPLEFDGQTDSIYHSFDLKGNRHMEYLNHRGEFADVPLEGIMETFRREYQANAETWIEGDFETDVARETGR